MIEIPGASTEAGRGRLRTREIRELSGEERRKVELLRLGESGFQIFGVGDLDRAHEPWLLDASGDVWIHQHGEPREGRRKETHSIEILSSGDWRYLTSAAASQRQDAPRDRAELEARAKRRERAIARQEKERETALKAARITARTVTLADVDPSLRGAPETLRGCVERLEQLGGYLRVSRGRLDVRVPPGELHENHLGVRLAKILYAAEQPLLDLTKGKDREIILSEVPDKAITPAGALA